MDTAWHAFCLAIHKRIEGDEWEELCYHYRELIQPAGAQKPSESTRAKAVWTMKAASDSGEFYDPAHKEDVLGRTKTRLERTPQRSGGGIGKGVGMLGSCLRMITFGFTDCRRCRVFIYKMGEGPCWERGLALHGPMGCCPLTHIIQLLERPDEVRAAWRALFLPHQEGSFLSNKGGIEVLCSCADTEGRCFEWSAPDGNRS